MTGVRIEYIAIQYIFLFLVAGWCGISVLMSFLSGWWELSRNYRSTTIFDGTRFRFQSASMRLGTSYGNCVNLGVNQNGLYLSVLFLFRLGHPPLFIPWPDVSTTKKRFLFFFKQVELRFGKYPSIRFVISQRLIYTIHRFSTFNQTWGQALVIEYWSMFLCVMRNLNNSKILDCVSYCLS